MNKAFFAACAIVCSALLIAACGGAKMATGDAARTSLDWPGTYRAILPCPDCEGVRTIVTLMQDNTYRLEVTALGKNTPPAEYSGSFSWNKTGAGITLGGLQDRAMPSQYLVGENMLTQLDLQGRRIEGSNAARYILRKDAEVITEKYWRLIEVAGQPLVWTDATRREPHLILKTTDGRIQGNSGCNTFGGTYEITDMNRVKFSGVASTRMACPDMAAENGLMKAFTDADNFTVRGDTLALNKARTKPALARFVVVYME